MLNNMLIVEWNSIQCSGLSNTLDIMRKFINKLTYVLMMIAMLGLSAQPLYAFAQHSCKHHTSSTSQAPDNAHCHQMQSDKKCDSAVCNCTIHASSQINIETGTSIYQFTFLVSSIILEAVTQYAQHFHNPLLRPPIS